MKQEKNVLMLDILVAGSFLFTRKFNQASNQLLIFLIIEKCNYISADKTDLDTMQFHLKKNLQNLLLKKNQYPTCLKFLNIFKMINGE